MEALVERGARVYAIAPPGRHASKFKEIGVEFVPFPLDRRTLNPLKAGATVYHLVKLLRKLRPDLLQTFTLRPNVYGALAGAHAGVPAIVCTVTGLGTLYTNETPGTRIKRRLVETATGYALRHAQVVVFQNHDDQRYFLERGLCRPEQTRLIPGSGVDIHEFSPERFPPDRRRELRARLGLPQDALVVLMVSRLIVPKGVYEFLETARRLRGQAVFVLIGETDPGNPDPLKTEEIKDLKHNGIVRMPGWQENIPEWLAVADIYVLPSYREGLPRTVLEAMAMGLPIITTDVPGCRETVLLGENGLLVPPRDINALAQALLTLIKDPKLRKQMGRRSRELAVQRFSLEYVIKEHLELYQEVIK